MRSNARILSLFGAAAALAALGGGCGSFLPEPDGGAGGGSGGCSSDSQCSSSVCNTANNTCMTACSSQSACSATQKCGRMDGSLVDGGTPGFCQCTDGTCGAQICQEFTTHLCGTGCAGNNPCPSPYVCETATGKCKPPFVDGGVCNDLDQCDPGKVCDFAAGQCHAAGSCSAANPQPDTCGYAGYCNAGTCGQVSKPSCANFTPPGGKTPVFNPRTSTGPIFWKIEDDAALNTAFCVKGFYVHGFYLSAYGSTDFATTLAGLNGVFYVDQNGNTLDLTGGTPGSYYVRDAANPKAMRLRVYLCATTAAPFSAGFYLTNGNEICPMTAGGLAGTTNSTTAPDNCGPGRTCDPATHVCG